MPEKITLSLRFDGECCCYVIERFKEKYWVLRRGNKVVSVRDTFDEIFSDFCLVLNILYTLMR